MGNHYLYRERIVDSPPVQNIVVFPPTSLATPALGYSGVTQYFKLTTLRHASLSHIVDSLTDLAMSVLQWPLPATFLLPKLLFYKAHHNEPSTYFASPISTTYKTPINVFQEPITDLSVIITTANKQTLHKKDGTIIAQREIQTV
jgi:hypothetical protein